MSRFNRITCRSLRATLRLELTATGAFLMTLPHVAELALEMATRWALDSSERSGLRQSRAVIRSLLYLLPCRILGLVLSNDRLAAAAELEIAWGDTRSRLTGVEARAEPAQSRHTVPTVEAPVTTLRRSNRMSVDWTSSVLIPARMRSWSWSSSADDRQTRWSARSRATWATSLLTLPSQARQSTDSSSPTRATMPCVKR